MSVEWEKIGSRKKVGWMNSDWIQKRTTNTNEVSSGISVIYRERLKTELKNIYGRKENRLTGGESVRKLCLSKLMRSWKRKRLEN